MDSGDKDKKGDWPVTIVELTSELPVLLMLLLLLVDKLESYFSSEGGARIGYF